MNHQDKCRSFKKNTCVQWKFGHVAFVFSLFFINLGNVDASVFDAKTDCVRLLEGGNLGLTFKESSVVTHAHLKFEANGDGLVLLRSGPGFGQPIHLKFAKGNFAIDVSSQNLGYSKGEVELGTQQAGQAFAIYRSPYDRDNAAIASIGLQSDYFGHFGGDYHRPSVQGYPGFGAIALRSRDQVFGFAHHKWEGHVEHWKYPTTKEVYLVLWKPSHPSRLEYHQTVWAISQGNDFPQQIGISNDETLGYSLEFSSSPEKTEYYIRLFDLHTGEAKPSQSGIVPLRTEILEGRIDRFTLAHPPQITGSPHQDLVAIADDTHVWITSTSSTHITGPLTATIDRNGSTQDSISGLKFARQGRLLITTSFGGRLIIWDTHEWKKLFDLNLSQKLDVSWHLNEWDKELAGMDSGLRDAVKSTWGPDYYSFRPGALSGVAVAEEKDRIAFSFRGTVFMIQLSRLLQESSIEEISQTILNEVSPQTQERGN